MTLRSLTYLENKSGESIRLWETKRVSGCFISCWWWRGTRWSLRKIKWFKTVVFKIDSFRAKYSVGTPGSQVSLTWNRKKKGKFSGRHVETTERFKAARAIKTTASRDAPVEKAQEIREMLDLQEEWIDISDTENENESKIFNQYLVKLQLNDELELIKKQSNVDGC